METIKTNYKYGFILVQPLRTYMEDGRAVLKRELPRLVNAAHILDIIIRDTDCLITLINGTIMIADKDELLNELRLL